MDLFPIISKRLLKTIFRNITVGLLRFEATDQLVIFISVPVVNISSAEQATGSCIDVHIAWWCYGTETLSTLLALCEENPPITSRCHDKETLWTLLALCEGNPSIAGGSLHKGPLMWEFGMSPNKLLNKWVSWQWFEIAWCSCNVHVVRLPWLLYICQ